MVLDPSPVTREQVYDWLQSFEESGRDQSELREFLVDQLGERADEIVDTSQHDGRPPQMRLVDVIMDDVLSYGVLDAEE